MNRRTEAPLWMTHVLILAGIYNVVWGVLVIVYPQGWFVLTSMPSPHYPSIWQCVGMMVAVFGIGYLLAARDPLRHWPIILVGLLGKGLGPIGFVHAAWIGELPWVWGLTLITNDLIWWVPFTMILYHAFRFHTAPPDDNSPGLLLEEAADHCTSNHGTTLRSLSSDRRLLLVFLRHAGCTFCRETLADLARQRVELKASGTRLAVVHMSTSEQMQKLLRRYDLDDIHHFSDPTCRIYRAFGLPRGTFWQLASPRLWWRGFQSAVLARHGFSRIHGDGFRMPGVFLLDGGRVIAELRHQSAADRPDYLAIAADVPSASRAVSQSRGRSHRPSRIVES